LLAEREPATAIQRGRPLATGRRAPNAFVRPSDDIFHSEIAKTDLDGTVIIVGSALSPPRESWLVTTDRLTGAGRRARINVQIPVDEVRAEFPIPLLGQPPPEEAGEALDHELSLVAVAEAYHHPNADEICWGRRQIIDWYLGKHPALAEHIQWHTEKGTRASGVRRLRALRLGQARCFNIPDAPPALAADAHQAEANRPGIAEWMTVWKLRHPQSSEYEELAAARTQYPNLSITRGGIRCRHHVHSQAGNATDVVRLLRAPWRDRYNQLADFAPTQQAA
jgi:hypothetical protein